MVVLSPATPPTETEGLGESLAGCTHRNTQDYYSHLSYGKTHGRDWWSGRGGGGLLKNPQCKAQSEPPPRLRGLHMNLLSDNELSSLDTTCPGLPTMESMHTSHETTLPLYLQQLGCCVPWSQCIPPMKPPSPSTFSNSDAVSHGVNAYLP